MRIGLDAMGGDYAPTKTVQGAILAHEENISAEIILFGDKKKIHQELKTHSVSKNLFRIIHCTEKIEMDEHPSKAFRNKPNSSIVKGFKYLAKNEIDVFASAGNTGAMFVGGYYTVKAISGVLRPCISGILPKENTGNTIFLDVGVNADCKPDVLYQFGLLGSIFAKHVCEISRPKVGLLNLGKERTKGNMLTQTAYNLMHETKEYNFVGNIEGRDLFSPEIDVIVCDGFTGNVVLKQTEAFYDIIRKRGIDDSYFRRFNYEQYGGTPILGLNKPVIIG